MGYTIILQHVLVKIMKDTKLQIAIGDSVIEVLHKTGMVNIDQLVNAGNKFRIIRGHEPIYKANVLRSASLKTFILAVQSDISEGFYSYFDVPLELIRTEGRTSNSKTLAFLPVALKIAAMLDPTFEAMIYRIFIEGTMLQLRDAGGENFKELNKAIDAYLPGREGKENRGVYITVAKMLNGKILGDSTETGWNHALVTVQHNELRKNIERDLITVLKMGLVRDWEHLKELIEKL